MSPRAHAKIFSGARQHDDKKICKKILLLRPKATTPNFFTSVVFVSATKNVAQHHRKIFCLENFSQKVFLMSLVTLVTGSLILG